jgi:xanthosine utilization system XapX-like protein
MRALTALVELGLSLAAQFAFNRQVASLRAESQGLVMSLTTFVALCLVAMTGVGFLLAALYAFLEARFSSPAAPAIMGGVLFVGAVIAMAVVQWRTRRTAAAAKNGHRADDREGGIPLIAGRTLAQKDAEAVIDELKRLVGTASPLAIGAAVFGLAVGLAGSRISHAMRGGGNGQRR